MIRSGDEPVHARSPLRLRLALALIGLAAAVGASVFFLAEEAAGLATACAVAALATLVDVFVIVRHIRRGAHYQPGRDIPPYRPVEGPREPVTSLAPLPRRTRERREWRG